MRPIDADAYANHLENALKESVVEVEIKSIEGFLIAATLTGAIVSDLRDEKTTPTIGAVEVMRCEDCKYWGIHKRLNIPWCREMHMDMGADDFCSKAKRRTDEDRDEI